MRDLITGATACPDPSASSSSANPLGALANALIGSSSKTQERLKEIPTSTPTGPASQFYSELPNQLPGSEFDKPFLDANSQGSEFFNRFRSAGAGGLEETWDEIQREGRVSQIPSSQPQLYDRGPPQQLHQPALDGTPQRVLSSFLHSFLDSSRGGIPFHPAPLPMLGLSEGDKQCIRDRSSIMARHLFADKSEEFINAQVNALLSSLDIDSNVRGKGPMPERFRELEDYWNESQGNLRLGAHAADGWIAEYSQNREKHDNPDSWANSFEHQYGVNGWVSEFEHSQLSSVDQMQGMNMSNFAAMEQTRMLANTLAQNADPKFQNSKFLQFVSKMSRGELIIDDNQVKETSLPASGDWAAEYQQQYNHGDAWAVFEGLAVEPWHNGKVYHGPDQWVNEFTTGGQQHGAVDDQWVDEFSKLNVNDWAEEFGQQIGEGASDNWAHAYDE
ncbi:peroxisomal targeting signal 1 receptor [Sesbania bispinosa]|nr:peroxisomal targeting signal 1 receptor [Sesbania bispinosa]